MGPHKTASFLTPPPIKGRMARGVRNQSSAADPGTSIPAVQTCAAHSKPPPPPLKEERWGGGPESDLVRRSRRVDDDHLDSCTF
jgi:hypothetical protein